jgi:hypothetical protein
MTVAGHGVPEETAEAVLASYEAQCEAMELGDTDRLDMLLADGFTLTHPTGVVQPKAEWLADLDADRIGYDRVDVVEVALAMERSTLVLTARTITEGTLHGAGFVWHLQLRTVFREVEGAWVAARIAATTW